MSTYQRPNIQRMQGYSWGEQPKDGQAIKLNTNENPYPPSPHVAAALNDFATTELRTYPQPTADALRERSQISMVSVEIRSSSPTPATKRCLAVTTYVSPGGTFASTNPSYSLYPVLAQIQTRNLLTSTGIQLDDPCGLRNPGLCGECATYLRGESPCPRRASHPSRAVTPDRRRD